MTLKEHLLSRHYDTDLYTNQVLDEEDNILTVYLTNLCGQFVGYQQYRPGEQAKRLNDPKMSRYFTYSPRGVNACWGLETLNTMFEDMLYQEFKALEKDYDELGNVLDKFNKQQDDKEAKA